MTKTNRNFKSIFKTFALAFTTLALMLGVFLGNALPKVQAEEADELTNYYTADKLEEIKISEIQFGDVALVNKHLLFDVTNFEEDYPMTPTLLELAGDNAEGQWGQINISYDDKVVDAGSLDITWKYFVGGDMREYVYLRLNNIPDGYEVMIFKEGGYAWHILEAIEVPEEVEPDEPTVEPDEPTVEPDEPTDEDKANVSEDEKEGFVEMLGNTAIEVFALENISAYSAGIATIGTFVAFIVVAGTALAIIAVSKK